MGGELSLPESLDLFASEPEPHPLLRETLPFRAGRKGAPHNFDAYGDERICEMAQSLTFPYLKSVKVSISLVRHP